MSDLAHAIGILLKFDALTLSGDFGHYTRVLVNLDLVSHLLETVILDTDGFSNTITVFYEQLLSLCSVCNNVCHDLARCRLVGKQFDKHTSLKKAKDGIDSHKSVSISKGMEVKVTHHIVVKVSLAHIDKVKRLVVQWLPQPSRLWLILHELVYWVLL